MFDFVPDDLINIILNPREEIVSRFIYFLIFLMLEFARRYYEIIS